MSHSVTIRTQTVTTSNNRSGIIVNSGYFKTWAGLLKTAQLIIGIICVIFVYQEFHSYNTRNADLFFLLMATTFMIGTFILLLSCLTSLSTESVIAKTIYELYYHALAFALLLAASITLLANEYHQNKNLVTIAAVLGLVNAVLYMLSTIFALRRYRGL